jgi:hypothetical protein
VAALPVAALAAGCDGQNAPTTEETQVATAELIGSVQLSATHDVKFWDYGNGLARIEENLHADLDRDATLSMKKLDLEGRALSDIYEIFAGANADPKVVEKLHALDLRLAAGAGSTAGSAPPQDLVVNGQATASDLARPSAATSAQTRSVSDGIEVRQSALACAEPSGFDWNADGQWFVTNYCFESTSRPIHMCQWSATSLAFGWSPPVSYYRSSGFNQSFCSTASYEVAEQIRVGGVPFITVILLKGTLPTRWVRDDAWTATGDAHFLTSIVSTTGSNRVGLATRMTQTGP